MDDVIIHDQPKAYIVWESRNGWSIPKRVAMLDTLRSSALNTFYGNLTGPYSKEEAERIVAEGLAV